MRNLKNSEAQKSYKEPRDKAAVIVTKSTAVAKSILASKKLKLVNKLLSKATLLKN